MQRSICRFCSHAITDLYGDWFHYSDAAVRQNGAPHEFRSEIDYLARAYTKYVHKVLAGSMPSDERFRMLDAADWPRRMKFRVNRKDARRIFVTRRRRTQ